MLLVDLPDIAIGLILIAPPSIRNIRLLVPLSSCNEAAEHLIRVLGGPEEATRFVGGIRWWQVRGIQGIDANWVAEKRDIEAIKRSRRERERKSNSTDQAPSNTGVFEHTNGKGKQRDEESSYPKEMDEMPCMLYLHGGEHWCCTPPFLFAHLCGLYLPGGYFFGSVDQERYCMQRYAR